MNKEICGDHCKYFRVLKTLPESLRIVGCIYKPCHEVPQPEGKPPEECCEGTKMAGDCEKLIKGQHWDECPYGGGWKK